GQENCGGNHGKAARRCGSEGSSSSEGAGEGLTAFCHRPRLRNFDGEDIQKSGRAVSIWRDNESRIKTSKTFIALISASFLAKGAMANDMEKAAPIFQIRRVAEMPSATSETMSMDSKN